MNLYPCILGEVSRHYHDRLEERDFPPDLKRKAASLAAALRSDARNPNGSLLFRTLTIGGSENVVVDFGRGYRAVIDLKGGIRSAFDPGQDIRNTSGRVWQWEDIQPLVQKSMEGILSENDVKDWRQARKQRRQNMRKEGLN